LAEQFSWGVAPGWYRSAPAARHSNLIRNIVSEGTSLFLIVMQIITGPDLFDRKTEAQFSEVLINKGSSRGSCGKLRSLIQSGPSLRTGKLRNPKSNFLTGNL
jgi:hypothetical protein